MDLGSWAHEAFAPVVLLNTTAEAERIVAKNGGLSVEQLLNAYGVFANANTPVRSVAGPVMLPEVRMRFFHAANFGPTPPADASAKLNQVIADSAVRVQTSSPDKWPWKLPPVASDADVPAFLRAIGGDSIEPLPWYKAFKHELLESFQCEETSMIYHPHANVLVVSSTEGDPRHAFQQLASPQSMPSVFQEGLYDMNIPKYYIVLHDVCETQQTSIDADAIYRNLGLPANSGGVMHINSLPTPNLESAPSWVGHPYVRNLPPLDHDAPFGCFLDDSDHQSIRNLLWDFATKCMLPQIEAKMFALNENVAAVKKGVKNAIRSWWRKPKDTSARSSVYVYRYDSIESNMLFLADMAFCIHDYDLALSMYRLVRDDYKTDKALLHCAHANECIALCLFLLRGSLPQIHNAIESCIAIYARLAATSPQVSTVRHATRTAVLASDMYAALFQLAPASDLMDAASAALIRGSSATDPSQPSFGICAAVLLERAAFCDLRSRTAKFRKYGFRMVMAGHVYATMGYTPHAARCYACARSMYANSRWFAVDDHITGTLAKQLYSLSHPQQAIALLLTRIGSGRHTKAQQQQLLAEFYDMVSECLQDADALPDFDLLETAEGHQKVLLVKNLAIPAITDASVVVFAPLNASGPAVPIDMDDAMWKQTQFLLLREEKIQAMATPHTHWRELATASSTALQLPLRNKKPIKAGFKSYIVHEWIYVEFEMKNHLACDVVLSQLHLFGHVGDDPFPSSTHVQVEYQDVTMAPFADTKVRLRLLPQAIGRVEILGVRWALNTAVHGEHSFKLPGILLQDSLQHRANRVRAPNDATRCDIKPQLPWLGVALTQEDGKAVPDPLVCMEGEVLVLSLTLSNHGVAPLTELTIVCSEWAYTLETPCHAVGALGHVTTLDAFALAPGASVSMRLVCQSQHVGTQTVRFLFRYNGGRVVPLVLEAETLSCLQLSHAIHPSYNRSGEYVLALTVQFNEEKTMVRIRSIHDPGHQWSLVPFEPLQEPRSTLRAGTSLQWQETSTLYFRLVPKTGSEALLHSVPLSPQVVLPTYAVLTFLTLQHAAERVLDFKKKKALEQGGNKAQLLRSIQSVRRDNKQTHGEAGHDTVPAFEHVPLTSPDALLHPEMDLHVVVQWAGTGPVVNGLQRKRCLGHSSVLNVQVRTPYTSSSNACPLTMTLDYAPNVRLGAVPMTLHLRNDASASSPPITFTLETLVPEEEHPSVRASSAATTTSARVFWAGVTRRTFNALPPGALVDVPLTAVFGAPGIYDLNRFRFILERDGQRPLTVFFPVEYLVHVAA
ncbi:hypothetical protein SPRG_07069 [Saprolegnia parasitica CBS 223.65]|uniref:Trafficking protein particle complex subunit 8 n=1 Tax=Saprolegnia parasitica (strain CBS 223.65) TaxID=695850 RepID=A0A067CE72_SAPPC|nr:hypothetical protein SPRG_07069 [Saprolegnia parasitica CBS 223.65]KDO27480.1 hypothetical protein SPRG_07069 [Saprolegnia parasitica CBS 223.65]|eukprot:XP_012201917.1 hypothetical protein SPRG_07069 [Saprolegnia parasitica CBS 223.65]